MDSTPSGPQANTDQGSAEVKALEEALSRLVGEGTASASDWRTKMASSDGLRAVEPSLYTTLRPADLKRKIGFLSATPPPGRRASRGLTLFPIVGFIGVGCILAWQFYDESAKETLASWASQLGWVQPLSGRKPPPGAGLKIAERPNSRALQEPASDLPQAAFAAQTAPNIGAPPAPAASSPEVQQAIEVIARDLADLRQTVNQLVVGQEQMARDIASLQSAEKDIRSRISAPKPTAAPARSPAPKPPPQATPQILAAPPPPAPPPPVQPAPDISAN